MFALCVVLPSILCAWYLGFRAVDRYVSHLAFSVRSEVRDPASEIGAGSYRDLDMIYTYLLSPEIVRIIDDQLGLGAHFSAPRDRDPVFSLRSDWTQEDLRAHWRRTLRIAYEPSRGMMALRTEAFSPEMAQQIANAILQETTRVINEMSAISREQAMQYAREDLARAENRLRAAREAFTTFRSTARMIDPEADMAGLNALLESLQAQLAVALIELDLLNATTRPDDPRISAAEREVAAIRARIEDERQRFAIDSDGDSPRAGTNFATLFAEYERLSLERQFAELTHVSARAALAQSQATAQLQSRYLVPHIRPTLASTAELPERFSIWFFFTLSCFLAWSVGVLAFYGARDAR